MDNKKVMEAAGVFVLVGVTTYAAVKAFNWAKEYYLRKEEQAEIDEELQQKVEKAKTKKKVESFGFDDPVEEEENLVFPTDDEPDDGLGSEEDYEEFDRKFRERYDNNREETAEIEEEDVEKLRYEPNTKEAWDQYVQMRLADIPEDVSEHNVMEKLYAIPFESNERIDPLGSMHHEIVDDHEEFFVEGKYVDHVTVGDVVMYWAEKTNFDIGDDNYWDLTKFCRMIFDASGFGFFLINGSERDIKNLVQDIQDNKLYHESESGKQYFGLFGLKEEVIRDGLPDELVRKPLYQIPLINQYWAFEGETLDKMEKDVEHSREGGYVNPYHEGEAFDDYDE